MPTRVDTFSMFGRLWNRLCLDQRTKVLRRTLIAFVAGFAVGLALATRLRAQYQLPADAVASYATGAGVLFLVAMLLLELKSALWDGGVFAKCFAAISFLLGLMLVVAIGGFAVAQLF
jgi:hypothetical protein